MRRIRFLFVIFTVLCLFTGLYGCFGDGGNGEEQTGQTTVFSGEFGSGFYTAGIDFPAGTYDVTAIEGSGNISSSNMFTGGLNQIMGVVADDIYITNFKGAKLPENTVLTLSGGLKVRINSEKASAKPLKMRVSHPDRAIELSSGNHTPGADFTAGVYNITAVAGNGTISYGTAILAAFLGVEPNEYLTYEREYKNVPLVDTNTLLKVSGVTVRLTPVTVS